MKYINYIIMFVLLSSLVSAVGITWTGKTDTGNWTWFDKSSNYENLSFPSGAYADTAEMKINGFPLTTNHYTGSNFLANGDGSNPHGLAWNGSHFITCDSYFMFVYDNRGIYSHRVRHYAFGGDCYGMYYNDSLYTALGRTATGTVYITYFNSSLNHTGESHHVGGSGCQPDCHSNGQNHEGIAWNGSHYFIVDNGDDYVHIYNRSGNYTYQNWSVGAEDDVMMDIYYTDRKFYLVGQDHLGMFEYNQTGNYTGFAMNFTASGSGTTPSSITYENTQKSFHIAFTDNDRVYEYKLDFPQNITIKTNGETTWYHQAQYRDYNVTVDLNQSSLIKCIQEDKNCTIEIESKSSGKLEWSYLDVDYSYAINISFIDETNNRIIEGENFNVYIEQGATTHSYIASTSPFQASQLSTGGITLKVGTVNYPIREYETTIKASFNNISTYFVNATIGEQRTFEVLNPENEELENASVEFRRLIDSKWRLVSKEYTDFAGKCSLYLDPTYKYKINFSKIDYLDKEIDLEPVDSSYTFKLIDSSIETSPIVESWNMRKIIYNLNYTNSTRVVLFEWNDTNNYAEQYCLDVVDMNTSYFSNCSVHNVSSMTYTITELNQTYQARARVKKGDRSYVLETIDINLRDVWQQLGRDSLLLSLFVFLTLSLIGLFSPKAAMIMGTAGLGTMYMFGILPIGFGTLMGVVFVVVIILIGMSRR